MAGEAPDKMQWLQQSSCVAGAGSPVSAPDGSLWQMTAAGSKAAGADAHAGEPANMACSTIARIASSATSPFDRARMVKLPAT
jgi:hypothetical protein